MYNQDIPNKLYDVNFWEYAPKRPIRVADLSSSHLLAQSFKAEKVSDRFEILSTKIQQHSDIGKTVWGYKKDNQGEAYWEYYFYLYKQNPAHTFKNLIDNVSDLFVNFKAKSNLIKEDYFLISFNLEESGRDEINIYYPDIKSDLHKFYTNGSPHYFDTDNPHAYLLKYRPNHTLEPSSYYYAFYPWPVKQSDVDIRIEEASEKIFGKKIEDFFSYKQLPFLKKQNGELHIPIIVAVKSDAIGLYFTNMEVENFILFLNYFQYPKEFISHVQNNKERYDYLQFDISFDMKPYQNQIIYPKGAFYGAL